MQTSQHDSQQTQAVSARSNKMGEKFTGNQSITAYKGFDADWTCRGFKYAIGKSYSHDGVVKACGSGFHACEHPLDVFKYYPPSTSKFAAVEQSGDISRDEGDTKIASRHIKIKGELSIAGLVSAAIEYVTSRCDPVNPESAASATGYRGAASATGKHAVACGLGINSRSMAGETGAIVLVYRNDSDQIVHIRASKVGENGITEGTFYELDADGQFVECVA